MPQRSPREAVSHAVRGTLVLATAGVLLAAGQAPVMADEGPGPPTRSDVEAARERVRETERSVEAIRRDLSAADARLEARTVEAAQAAENHNAAMWELRTAREEARQAQRRADRQSRLLERRRRQIGGLVARTYQNGSSFGQVNAYLTSEDPDRLLDRVSAYRGAADTLLGDFERLAAQRTLAGVFRDQAEEAVEAADHAAEQAEQAEDAAAEAVAAQEQAVAAIGQRRDALLRELAEAQDISVELATRRQEALEERERRRQAREARERAEAERREEQRREKQRRAAAREERQESRVDPGGAGNAEASPADRRAQRRTSTEAAERRAQQRAQQARERRERRERARREREQRESEREQEEQESSSPPPSSGGAGAAIAFARAQLGEPYAWGAAGPDEWDCSGLTMRAWGAGGRSLPHNSGMQYDASTPISYGRLRRGDLIFWSSNGSSSGIYHVALYLGNDRMIHAPNSESSVRIDSIWYMGEPSHYGRV